MHPIFWFHFCSNELQFCEFRHWCSLCYQSKCTDCEKMWNGKQVCSYSNSSLVDAPILVLWHKVTPTAAASVSRPTMLVGGASTTKCAVVLQLPALMKQTGIRLVFSWIHALTCPEFPKKEWNVHYVLEVYATYSTLFYMSCIQERTGIYTTYYIYM